MRKFLFTFCVCISIMLAGCGTQADADYDKVINAINAKDYQTAYDIAAIYQTKDDRFGILAVYAKAFKEVVAGNYDSAKEQMKTADSMTYSDKNGNIPIMRSNLITMIDGRSGNKISKSNQSTGSNVQKTKSNDKPPADIPEVDFVNMVHDVNDNHAAASAKYVNKYFRVNRIKVFDVRDLPENLVMTVGYPGDPYVCIECNIPKNADNFQRLQKIALDLRNGDIVNVIGKCTNITTFRTYRINLLDVEIVKKLER